MYFNFPGRSEFLDPMLIGIEAGKDELRHGRSISIRLKQGGYQGTWAVILLPEDKKGFEVDGAMADPSRFPQRIRVAAWALHQKAVYGRFVIAHDHSGLLTIREETRSRESSLNPPQARTSVLGSETVTKPVRRDSLLDPSNGMDLSGTIHFERIISAAIRAARPGGLTRSYFEKEGVWEAATRQRFAEITAAVARDKAQAQYEAIELLKVLGNRYKAIWPDTKITYPVFYSVVCQTIDHWGWWARPSPMLYGSSDGEASVIAGVIRDALTLFVSRGDSRNYSLLTKWLHFSFPDTFAIYDGNAARSIQEAMSVLLGGEEKSGLDREQFLADRIGNTNGVGYIGLLNFYRLCWNAARSAGLEGDLKAAARENEELLRSEPRCGDGRESTVDVLDKLLWKANGQATLLGIGKP